ncbi:MULTISPECIES: 2-amino-4-hydroxy-6-hydroxymethyldihydropteridine diphosphokinase [Kocuria]|uniref:2-amino-4-hydroxy-6-hydroxymethyldihydropteridine diphosphokinase n=1 Tax=Kocuria oceani TaxID=988827 RepID=A0ABV9TLF9_9MICC|nr:MULTISPECIES: 2-amino-4-hydroxy-6-hydroxymethyldihydropteridine diphosphokinase [Kocuria]KLU08544.1 2-amino-4-hydroxy-6-hydroxymethyldihydropteridine pyrophosphokinase [Kocuria sp. SM24M-10]OLT06194.1 2-amino-4-hydroxy-6-hydroxymethyldihydropteridine diphosphokinase [Kocuria sp. CNJ-770]
MATLAVLALGANLGDREDTLRRAALELAAHPRITLVRSSPVVRSKPVGGPPDQGDYLNAVVEVDTDLSPFALLRACQEIEQLHHRTRTQRWGPRTLDIDIVVYGELRLDEPELTVPHLRAATRAFVLVPWALMDPAATLEGRRVADLAREAEDLGGLGPDTVPLLPAGPGGEDRD